MVQGPLPNGAVEAPEQACEAGWDGDGSAGKSEGEHAVGAAVALEAPDGGKAFATEEQAERDQAEEGKQGEASAVASARIGKVSADVGAGTKGHGSLRASRGVRPCYSFPPLATKIKQETALGNPLKTVDETLPEPQNLCRIKYRWKA